VGAAHSRLSVLLGSGGIATEARRKLYRKLVSEHFSGCSEVLFIPYASNDHSAYTERMGQFLAEAHANLVGIESKEDPMAAIRSAEAIYVGGGNSFLLISELHERGLIEPIREAVLSGTPYLGVSAGANVACPTMMTTNDMPIAHPGTFESLGIVPFQINPHYHPGKVKFLDGGVLKEHFGESRDQRIAEFHRSFDTPVIGMWEGSFVHWNGSSGNLTGKATAFVKGQDPFEIPDGYRFYGDLGMEG
jgi:dipeptidase E